MAGYIKDEGTSYAKLFLLKALTDLLSTANFASQNHETFQMNDDQLINQVCGLLTKTCQSGELLQISYALDGFYEIFSEDFYDKALIDHGVV